MKICICCSLTFTDEVNEVAKMLENLGHEVLLPNGVIHRLAEQPGFDPVQAKIDTDSLHAHIDKIRSSDAVLVCNFLKNCTPGYIGANSFIELAAARYFDKPIYALFPLPDFAYINDEIRSFDIKVLNYDLTQLPASNSYIGYSTRQLSFPEPAFTSEPAAEPAFTPEPAAEPAFTPEPAAEPAFTPEPAAETPAPAPSAPFAETVPTSASVPAVEATSAPIVETTNASAAEAAPAPAAPAPAPTAPVTPTLPTVDPAAEQAAIAEPAPAQLSADERKSLLTQVRDNWFSYWNRHQRN